MNGIYYVLGETAFWGGLLLAAFAAAMTVWLKLYSAHLRRIAREHHADAPWLDPASYGLPGPCRPPEMPRRFRRAATAEPEADGGAPEPGMLPEAPIPALSEMHEQVRRYLAEAAGEGGAR